MATGTLIAAMLLLQLLALASSVGLLEMAPLSLPPEHARLLGGITGLLAVILGLALLVAHVRKHPSIDQSSQNSHHEPNAESLDASEIHSQFLSMVAHEVRTPLSVITASTGTLRLLAPDNQPAIGERIERIDRAVRRMKRLFQLCLDAERIERHKNSPERWPAVASLLIKDVAREMDDDIAARIQLQDETAGLEIPVDRRMLGIVFSNLIDNAVKYSPAGTPITVHLEFVAPDSLQIDVIDQGPGIPEALSEKIFEKHFRRQELNDVPGLGLGLYLARRILNEHGGSITALAAIGGHFRIRIPTRIVPN